MSGHPIGVATALRRHDVGEIMAGAANRRMGDGRQIP